MPSRSTPSTSNSTQGLQHSMKECFVPLRRLNPQDVFSLSLRKKNGIRIVPAVRPCSVNVNPINWNPIVPLDRVPSP